MKQRKIHFIGIGGIGVSALAQYYLATGNLVSGSDVARSDITGLLAKRGIKIFIGQSAQNISDYDLVVHSAAIKQGNPEYDESKKRGVKTILYAEAIGELTKKYKTIAVSGSHGKSTTTAMIALILIQAGLDPTVIVGTKLRELENNNFRLGKSEWLVLEADEYNRSFHSYHPQIIVLTNIDAEHLDIYGDLEGVKEGFARYLKNLAPDGTLIANGQDKTVRTVVGSMFEAGARQVVIYNDQDLARHHLGVPGLHNQSNAEAAYQVGKLLGVGDEAIRFSLKGFHGTWRRLEEVVPGVYSDYAHHPTEIRASLTALKEANPSKKLICVFQPHQRDRLNHLFDEFKSAFAAADEVILIPLYAPAGRSVQTGKTSADLASKINQGNVQYADSFDEAYGRVEGQIGSDALVVFMGAGDIDDDLRVALA